jgi:hypothetical protein
MKRKRILLAAILVIMLPGLQKAGEVVSAASGSWTAASTWVGGIPPVSTDHVTILAGHTVILPSSGTRACANLLLEQGAKLWANSSSSTRYLDIFGNIICNGTLGNGPVYDALALNLEGVECAISGSGTVDLARVRKNTAAAPTTTLTVEMNVNLRYGGTVLYNNAASSNFHVIIEIGATLNCCGNGAAGGIFSIDGTAGNGPSLSAGSVFVHGTLTVTGKLYLQTNNTNTAFPVSLTVCAGGVVNADSVICGNSGAAGHVLTVQEGGRFNLTGSDWGNAGQSNNSYNFNSGSVMAYTGPGLQVVGDLASYAHLEIAGAGEKQIHDMIIAGGDLSIAENTQLKVFSGGSLTVAGTSHLGSSECLQLMAGIDSLPSGSFINQGLITGTGTMKAERFLTGYYQSGDARYHMLSSPVINQQIQPGFVEDPPLPPVDFYRWDEPSGQWINTKDLSGAWNTGFQPGDDRTFHPGRGYLAAYPAGCVRSFSGIPNTGDAALQPEYNVGQFSGFNLTGNPFPCALTGDIPAWPKSNVSNAIWVWDGSIGNYRTWNGLSGSLSEGIIPAMQGFFVMATGPGPALTIPAASRVHSNLPFLKESRPDELVLELSDGIYRDILVVEVQGADPGVPGCDVSKFTGHPAAPQFYARVRDSVWSVITITEAEQAKPLSLGFRAGGLEDLTIHVAGAARSNQSRVLILEDLATGQSYDLHDHDNITLHAGTTGAVDDRLLLRFRNPSGQAEFNPLQQVTIASAGDKVIITGLPENGPAVLASIYDLSGRKLFCRQVTPSDNIPGISIPGGICLVQLTCGSYSLSRKIFLTNGNL